jgi:hypothetical protein
MNIFNSLCESEFDIFLSYNWDQKLQVKRLKDEFTKTYGLKCCLDQKEIKNSNVFIVCISVKYCLSDECTNEINYAKSINKPIIILMLERLNIQELADICFTIDRLIKINNTYPLNEPIQEPEVKFDVFFSFNWDQKLQVRRLNDELTKTNHLKCCLDQQEFKTNSFNAILNSKIFVSCISPRYSMSDNFLNEINYAKSIHKLIMVLMLVKPTLQVVTDIGFIINKLTKIDVFKNDYNSSFIQEEPTSFNQVNIKISGEIKSTAKNLSFSKLGNKIAVNLKKEVKEEKSFDIFLSYNWDQKDQIRKLYEELINNGFKCWLYNEVLKDPIKMDQIFEIISNSKIFVNCITEKYCKSKQCISEINYAKSINKPIVIIMLVRPSLPILGDLGLAIDRLTRINAYFKYEANGLFEEPSGELLKEV